MLTELPRQWHPLALLALAGAGVALANVSGPVSLLLCGVPGAMILASALALFALPGDARITAYLALGSGIGIAGALGLVFVEGLSASFAQAVTCLMSLLVAGRAARLSQPSPQTMPALQGNWQLDLAIALDEAMLGYFVASVRVPGGEAARRVVDDASTIAQLVDAEGWRQDPSGYHLAPPLPVDLHIERKRIYGFGYEQLRCESQFQPHPGLPGAASWDSHVANRHANAWLLRHPGPARPWLVCVHGYRMGGAWLDFTMFRHEQLYQGLGVNLLIATLPLHGPRKAGWRSGDGYLDGDLRELLIAETQALWDLRRWLLWLRQVEMATQVGVYGVSLGARSAALLASYEAELDFVVASMPLVDAAHNLWRFMPNPHRSYFAAQGMDERALRALLHPVSPLARPALPEAARLQVVAATADRVVLPDQPLALAHHWGSAVHWFQGSHLSYRRSSVPPQVLAQAARRAGWPLT